MTPEGEAQAAALARRLAGAGLDEVQSSPRARTRATAAAVAQASGALLRVESALDEIDFGAWTGAAFADLKGDPAWEGWNRARATARPPGGEGMAEAAGRIARHAATLAAGPDGRRVALVTHCDMIRALVATILGLSLDNLLRFEVDPASVTTVEAGPGWSRLLTLNAPGACWAAA